MVTYPTLTGTAFGEVTVGDETFGHDVYLLANGTVQKRKKKLARQTYGTAHHIGPEELKRVCLGKPKVVFIGTGQQGVAALTEEGQHYLDEEGITCTAMPTSEILSAYNQCDKPKAARIHVTC
jgi:hypothetical protein